MIDVVRKANLARNAARTVDMYTRIGAGSGVKSPLCALGGRGVWGAAACVQHLNTQAAMFKKLLKT